MHWDVAEMLVEYAPGEAKVVTGYSGKGMGGKNTTGVTFGSHGDIFVALAGFIRDVSDWSEEDREAMADALELLCSDSMGLGTIYY